MKTKVFATLMLVLVSNLAPRNPAIIRGAEQFKEAMKPGKGRRQARTAMAQTRTVRRHQAEPDPTQTRPRRRRLSPRLKRSE
jgi:hypothetical protein